MMCRREDRGALSALVAAAAFAIATGAAAADTDIGAGNGDRITATLAAADEVATFRYDVPAGATFSISAQGAKKRGAPTPTVTFRVLEPDGDEAAPFQPVKRNGAKLANLVATASGAWRVEVKTAGAATGDFKLTVKWKAPAKVPVAATLAPGETTTVPFTTDAGGTATFSVAPAKGSAALARLIDVRNADDSFVLPFSPPAATAKSQRAANVTLPSGGDFLLTIGSAATSPGPGDIAGSIVPKLPKLRPRAVTVTAKQIGAGDDAAAVGQVIGPEGGAVLVGDEITGVAGAAVQIPSGALTFPAAIVIGTSTALAPPGGLGAAGPAVFFGPEGTKFGEPVTITIPYDVRASTSTVRVFTRDAKGKVTEVLPASLYVFDAGAGTVSFPSSHFSSYQAFSPPASKVSADFNGDGVADLVLPSSQSGASEQGRIDVFFGGASLASTTTSSADVTFTGIAPNDGLGRSIASVDVNGDGVDDLCAGLRGATRFVVVWFGGPGFAGGGAPDLTITPGANDPNFGISLSGGDLNGDGKDDLVVGDESNSRAGTTNGACFVFFGPLAGNLTADDADVIITGAAEGDLFGAIVAVGDVANAGTTPSAQDLIVGADQIDNATVPAGSVYLFGGDLAPGLRSASSANVILTGEASGDGFGLPLEVGDIDGDGRPDLVVSARNYDDGSLADAGRVYVYLAPPATGIAAGATPSATLTGVATGEDVGHGLAVANYTGSAAAEIAVGVPGSAAFTTDAGGVFIWTGRTTATIASLPAVLGSAVGRRIGEAFVNGADVDGDGLADLIIGDPLDTVGGTDAGAAFVVRGTSPTFPASSTLADAPIIIRGAAGQQLGR